MDPEHAWPVVARSNMQRLRSFVLVLVLFSFTASLFSTSFAFRQTCHPLSMNHLPTRRWISAALFVRENGNVGVDVDKKRNRLQQRQRRHITIHRESHLTAAGAESLFSFSLWGTFFKSRSAKIDDDITLTLFEPADLPAIDCEWACHSEEEKTQLQQMKLLLKPELQKVINEELDKTYPDVYSDLRLLRFLRKSQERDIVSSSERYRSFLKWREDNNVDKIRGMVDCSSGVPTFIPAEGQLQTVASYFPMKFDCMADLVIDSNDGHSRGSNNAGPAILDVGSFDTLGISKMIMSTETNVSLENFLNYWIYIYESIHFQLHRQSVHFGKMMFLDPICDISDLSIKQFSPYFVTKVMKPWLRMTQSHYPETTRRIHVLNPPGIIKFAWNVVTPVLSQGTVDKIRFEKAFNGTADEFCCNITRSL
ncbi:hypothetical protein ACHAWF_003258 [Thalassiosira exigua]